MARGGPGGLSPSAAAIRRNPLSCPCAVSPVNRFTWRLLLPNCPPRVSLTGPAAGPWGVLACAGRPAVAGFRERITQASIPADTVQAARSTARTFDIEVSHASWRDDASAHMRRPSAPAARRTAAAATATCPDAGKRSIRGTAPPPSSPFMHCLRSLGNPEDLECFANELPAVRREGKGRAGPVNDGESGGYLDLADHLLEGTVAASVECARCCGEAVMARNLGDQFQSAESSCAHGDGAHGRRRRRRQVQVADAAEVAVPADRQAPVPGQAL